MSDDETHVVEAEFRRPWYRVRFLDDSFEASFRAATLGARRRHVIIEILLLALITVAVAPIEFFEDPHWQISWALRFGIVIPIKIVAMRMAWVAQDDRRLDLASMLSFCGGVAVMAVLGLLEPADLQTRHFPILGAIILIHSAFSSQRNVSACITLCIVVPIFGMACFQIDRGSSMGMLNYAAFIGAFSLVALVTHHQVMERTVRAFYLRERRHALLMTELDRRAGELERLVCTDMLTGLGNRRLLEERLDDAWRDGVRHGEWVGLALLDIDYFKQFNDAAGHVEGDGCLRRIAACLGEAFTREGVTVARFGGEEFALVVPGASPETILRLGEQARNTIEALAIPHPGRPDGGTAVTVSIGVSCLVPSPVTVTSDLLRVTDEALYEAKHQGRNRVVARAALPAAATGPAKSPAVAGRLAD